MRKFTIGKAKRFFALPLVFMLIFSVMPAVYAQASETAAPWFPVPVYEAGQHASTQTHHAPQHNFHTGEYGVVTYDRWDGLTFVYIPPYFVHFNSHINPNDVSLIKVLFPTRTVWPCGYISGSSWSFSVCVIDWFLVEEINCLLARLGYSNTITLEDILSFRSQASAFDLPPPLVPVKERFDRGDGVRFYYFVINTEYRGGESFVVVARRIWNTFEGRYIWSNTVHAASAFSINETYIASVNAVLLNEGFHPVSMQELIDFRNQSSVHYFPDIFQAAWRNARFVNNQPAIRSSNNALASEIAQFLDGNNHNITRVYRTITDMGHHFVDTRKNTGIRNAISQGFRNDAFSQVKPFSPGFVDTVLNNTYFVLTQHHPERRGGGSYHNRQAHSFVWVRVNPDRQRSNYITTNSFFRYHNVPDGRYRVTWGRLPRGITAPDYIVVRNGRFEVMHEIIGDVPPGRITTTLTINEDRRFRYGEIRWSEWNINVPEARIDACTFTTLHELAHALGLGETLADLFAEKFMGIDSRGRADYNLAYNSTLDRLLLERAGAVRFWEAAYSSNADFGALWDEYFGDIISHDEIQLIRGISLETNHRLLYGFRPYLEREFQNFTGISTERAFTQFHNDLVSLIERGNRHDNRTFERFRGWVDAYVSFAVTHNVRPSASVLDNVVASHIQRYRGF